MIYQVSTFLCPEQDVVAHLKLIAVFKLLVWTQQYHSAVMFLVGSQVGLFYLFGVVHPGINVHNCERL